MKNLKKVLLIGLGAIVALVLAAVTYILILYSKCAEDFARLKEESYDTVFFSMYPIDNYDEADYEYFRGMKIVKSTAVIPDTRIMKAYMDIAARSGNTISTAYLGIDPTMADLEDVFQITLENPGTAFEIVLAYPQMNYWLAMDDEECKEAWEIYRDFAGNVLGLENVSVYYFCNEEWLLCNPGNYVDTFNTNVEVSELLMGRSDFLHDNILNVNNFHERFNQAWELIEKYRMQPAEYPDASDLEIIFFGDSVIGNYVDSMSIPGVVNGLTGAAVYNCGYGGKSAALSHKTLEPISKIVNAFVEQDTSGIPVETQAYVGMEQYIQSGNQSKEKMFIINYGLNDYFDGVPVATEDPHDIASYSGAMRVAIKTLKETYPEAEILLMTPNLSIEFDAGEGIQSEVGGKLQEYADAVIKLAEELDVEVLDNFRVLPITKERHWELLADGTHPNEQGRYLIGTRIIEVIDSMTAE